MRRRTLLKSLAAAVAVRPAAALAQSSAATTFSAAQIEILHAIAEVVLPAEIGAEGRRRAVEKFVSWFANYRQGADMGHGYGASTLRAASGPSPFSRYAAQFVDIAARSQVRGGPSFQALAVADRRGIIEALLNTPQPVNRLPSQPTGANLVADLMGSYFTGADAWDACYRAEIQRDGCRTLDNSADPPRPIRTT